MKWLSSYPNPTTKQNNSKKLNAPPFPASPLTFYETSENVLLELK